MKIKNLRIKIDGLDRRIVSLLNERADLILEIGKLKKKLKLGAFAPDREQEVYYNVLKNNKGPLTKAALKAIYREIMSSCISLEENIAIAYLGPKATFTHLASIKKFGWGVEYVPCKSITDVFLEVEKDRCSYGVVPVENSFEGVITHTLDMFVDSDLKVCSEIVLEVSHNLLANCAMDKIKRIYSKAEVFSQCRLWLEDNLPKIDLIEVSSTAKAAEIVSKEKVAACIASSIAAKEYGLRILAKAIEDSPHNMTRFLVIGKIESMSTKRDKTSIMFSIKDRIGALHDMLVPFKKYRINLTKIESRPSKKRPWDYYFFVDLLGHVKNVQVKKALDELEENCKFLKVLGSYPKDVDYNGG